MLDILSIWRRLAMQYREYILNSADPESVIGAGYLERSSQADLFQYETFTDYRLSIVLEGSGLLIDGETNNYPLTACSVYQSFPGQTGSLYIDFSHPWKEFQIKLSAPAVQALQTLSSFHNGARVFKIELFPHITLWMNDIIEAMAVAPPALMIEHYFDLQRLILDIHMQKESNEDSFALSLIHRASLMVLKDSRKPVSIEEMADSFYISQARLNRIFRKYTRTTPLKYLQHLRFCFADRLLHEGQGIREVAAMFGYADQFTFSKQFKRSMGISPSISRKRGLARFPGNIDSSIL